MRRIVPAAGALLLLVATTGCESLRYYGQAVAGHLALMRSSVPIDELLARPDTPAELGEELRVAAAARVFASETLRLPDNNSYTHFVAVPGAAITYNVVATPEFSMEPRRWCFPVVGCVNYRGYFARRDAENKATQLRNEGYDVVITFASAYSTLGWFDDPLPETVLRGGRHRMVSLIFHELAHQQLYRDHDTAFNESYASAVAIGGLHQWLLAQGEDPSRNTAAQQIAERQQVLRLLQPTREALVTLYAGDLPPEIMRQRKSELLASAQARYAAVAAGLPRWENWFATLNNARLVSLADYSEGVPGFLQLLETCGGNWACFHARAQAIANDPLRRDALMSAAYHAPTP